MEQNRAVLRFGRNSFPHTGQTEDCAPERCRGDSDNDVSDRRTAVVCGPARSNYIRRRPPWRDRKLNISICNSGGRVSTIHVSRPRSKSARPSRCLTGLHLLNARALFGDEGSESNLFLDVRFSRGPISPGLSLVGWALNSPRRTPTALRIIFRQVSLSAAA